MQDVEKEVLKEIKPDKKERNHFQKVTKEFVTKLNSKLKGAKAIMGGSGAKDTWLSGNHDVDVFVSFPLTKYKKRSDQLSDLLEPQLKKAFKEKRERLHGSRDYFRLKFKGIDFEVIPILKINQSRQAINITDVSPLHSKWVNQNLKNKKDEVRLAKKFFRANKLYGAESYLNGFSGYVLEILIAQYGSFENLLKQAINWKLKEVIDVEKHYPKNDALFYLNKSKQTSPLIVVDPVDKNRNAAAALGIEKFTELKKVAKKYLDNPRQKFFEKATFSLEKLKQEAAKRKNNLLFLEILALKGKEDVVGVKLRKAFEFLEKNLEKFGIKKAGWEWNKHQVAEFYFILDKKELPKYEIRSGPPLKIKQHVERFKREHAQTFMENNRIMARVPVKFPQLKEVVKNLVNENYFKERIKRIKEIKVF